MRHITEQAIGHYPLTLREVRNMAYEYAINLNRKKYGKERASYRWLKAFRHRNNLVKRVPQLMSLNRAKALCPETVKLFYEKLESLYEEYKFPPSRIYNVDETGVTTVPPSRSRVLVHKTMKNVQQISTAERGTLTTVILGMNATGQHITPAIIYPRKKQDDLRANLPSNYKLFYSKNGWVNSDIFFKYMKHFIENTQPTSGSPVLLLYDNHSSHLADNVIQLAKQSHVHILTIIPHSSHVLQPLDVGFNRGFKLCFSDMVYAWMKKNQDKPFMLKETLNIIKNTFEKCVQNKSTGPNSFKKCGIYPLDKTALNTYIKATADKIEPYPSTFFIRKPIFAGLIPAKTNRLKSSSILTEIEQRPEAQRHSIKLTIRRDQNGFYKANLPVRTPLLKLTNCNHLFTNELLCDKTLKMLNL